MADADRFRDQTSFIEEAIISLLSDRGSTTEGGLMNLACSRASKAMGGEMVELKQYEGVVADLLDSGRMGLTTIPYQDSNAQPGYQLLSQK